MIALPYARGPVRWLAAAGIPFCLLFNDGSAVALDHSVRRTVKAGELVSLGKHLVREKNCDTTFPDIALVVPPKHGTVCVEVVTSTDWVSLRDPPPYPHCKGRRSRGLQVTYAPAPGYSGWDRIQYDVTWPKGDVHREVTVTVKSAPASPFVDKGGAQAPKRPQEPGPIPTCVPLTS